MSNFDFGIALVFSLVVFVLGLSFARGGNSVKSFFAAGGAVPWWISGLSLFMSFFSVGTFVVWGSIAYKSGMVAVVIQTTMSIAGFIVGFIIAPKWNKTNALTAAEFISQRLGFATQKFYTYIFLFISLFSGGAFLYPVGKMIEVTVGLPLELSIILLGALIIIYTAVGGLWAVLVTDVLQFVVLTAAVLIVVPLAFDQIGGISQFIQATPPDFFALTNSEYDWLFMAAFGFYNMVFIGGSWAYVQRYTSVKNPQDAKKVGWLFGGLYLFAPLIWMLPPMIYRAMHPDTSQVDAEGAYLLISQQVVPDGLMGLILGAMVFATASSVNTTLNIAAGVFTNDIYKPVRKSASSKETMIVARSATFIFGILAVCVALSVTTMGGIVEVAFSLAAITGVALFLPPIWAMFSKYQTGRAVVSATCISLAVNAFFKFVAPDTLGFSLARSPEMLVGVLVPIASMLTFELYYRAKKSTCPQYQLYQLSQEKQKSQINADEQADDDSAANMYGRKIIAIGILLIGLMIAALGLLANTGGIIISAIGLFIILCGVVIYPSNLKMHVSELSQRF
ncbi:sodium/solute symporter [Catenovulum agarivorans DS-2]|uniref:Sodium/solute symporter n=1 Tax=Catenovulum agarivorans DS-2 TaxID=1328313 RepID=W7QMU0_9ALTE|nr:sodium:solute symporter family protein [Catenovulum agarivorans]EWH09233.1 sodium/solute symporter [Catenovulum agarivorans DS-2]